MATARENPIKFVSTATKWQSTMGAYVKRKVSNNVRIARNRIVSIALAAPAIKWTMSEFPVTKQKTDNLNICIDLHGFCARTTRNSPLVHYSVFVNLIAKTAIENLKFAIWFSGHQLKLRPVRVADSRIQIMTMHIRNNAVWRLSSWLQLIDSIGLVEKKNGR